MKIRYKLVYLLFFLGFLFLFVFIIQETYEDFKSKELFKSVGAEQKYVFNKILDLKSGSLKSFAYDYSFWGEMVDFVKSPDMKWAHENIDTALETFGADAAWVYDRDGRLVYAIDKFSKGNFLQEIPIPTEVITGLFGSAPLCHFFANTHNGLMEFYGAVIQPSEDIKREQPAKGYLFCGRLWSARYIAELSRLTDSEVDLAESAADAGFVSRGGRILKFSKALPGWDGRPLKYIVVSVSSLVLKNARDSDFRVALLFLLCSGASLLILVFFIFRWINAPLKLITLSLEKGDPGVLKKLKKSPNEFGDVARMMDSFFSQRKVILDEVSLRKRRQDALDKVNYCFVSFGVDPNKNIQLICDTAGQILGATSAFYNRLDGEMLVTEAAWKGFPGLSRVSPARGRICSDIINSQSVRLTVVDNLQHTVYAESDPNVKNYDLRSYVGFPVRTADQTVAVLCTVFKNEVKIDQFYLDLLQVLGKAASVEEDRRRAQEIARIQAHKLDNALKEALKSRQILLSMLEDNNLNKIKLEHNIKELAAAYAKLKESQEELVQAEKFGAIGQLASSVAHEVRNPLAIIMQSIDYLVDRVAREDREIIQMAKTNIGRANTIISALLDFSRKKKLNMVEDDINSIINDSVTLTQYSNIDNKIKVVKELSEGLPKVMVDRQKIEQVLVNVILNAFQAMPGGGRLFLRSYLEKPGVRDVKTAGENVPGAKKVVIEVEDEGSGISEENLKNLFRPFFTTKGEMLGVGLGLSVAKDIIGLHSGRIEISSKVNVGTKVTIILKERGV